MSLLTIPGGASGAHGLYAPHPSGYPSGGASVGATAAAAKPAMPAGAPSGWGLREAQQAVAAACLAPAGLDARGFDANLAYCEARDAWQGGRHWPGPPGDPAKISRQFCPVDVVGEVLRRVTDALTKRWPTLAVVPLGADGLPLPAPDDPADGSDESADDGTGAPPAGQAAVRAAWDEAAAVARAVEAWALRVGLVPKAAEAVARSRWAGRGHLRVWVRPGRLVAAAAGADAPAGGAGVDAPATVLPTGLTLADALDCLDLSAPLPHEVAVVQDPATGAPACVFTARDADGRATAEVWTVERAADGAEPDASGTGTVTAPVTVCRVLRDAAPRVAYTATGAVAAAPPAAPAAFRLPVGGRLPIVELAAPLLITDAVRRQQARLDFAESMMNRILETAGFRERYIINATPNGTWTPRERPDQDALATEVRDGRPWYLYPAPRTLGAGTSTELQGRRTERVGANGEVSEALATPSVQSFEPTDPAYVTNAAAHARATILRSCRQGHVLGADAAQSGISREEARAEFEADVSALAEPLERLLADAVGYALALAALMVAPGTPGAVPAAGTAPSGTVLSFRAEYTVTVDTGPASPDAQRADGEAVAAGRLSLETALVRAGVDDVRGELDRLAADPLRVAALARAQAEAAAAWVAAGAGLRAAALRAGLDEAAVDELVTNGGVAPGLDDPDP